MKINTCFNIGDKAYVLEDRKCYECEIISINIKIENHKTIINYGINKYIATGLLSEIILEEKINEENLFLTKGDVKNKLKEIKNAEELIKEFPNNRE